MKFFATMVTALSIIASALAIAQETSDKGRDDTTINIGKYQFNIEVPAGTTLELLTAELEVPRVLHFAGERLFVGSRSGKVYWLDPPYVTANLLVILNDYPHSVVVHEDTLYVAQSGGIYAADYREQPATLPPESFRLVARLPAGGSHSSRTLKTGPDKRLYVSLGISGNCSNEYLNNKRPFKEQRGGIAVVPPSSEAGGGTEDNLIPFASGLRNPVGFDWHPQTGVMYASNNGPDHSGFNEPAEVFARVTENSFHGMPWYQVTTKSEVVSDPCIDTPSPQPASEVSLPVARFPARVAPMDVAFIDQSTAFAEFQNDALVALHGSWATENGHGNGDPSSRRHPKIVRVDFEAGSVVSVQDFVTGFQLPSGSRWARPVGIAMGPDGHIYMTSDDGIQGLFRLSR